MKKLKHDNRGLSLLEFIIAAGIALLVFTVVASLSSSSIFQYKSIGTDTNLQNEAQLTSNQIRDWLIEVNKGISWEEEYDYSKLSMYYITNENESNEKKMIGIIKYTPADSKITYKLYEYGTDESDAEEYLLSDKINDFTCDTNKVFTENLIVYDIRYVIGDKAWEKSNEFTFRNSVRVVGSPSEVFGT